MISFIDFALRRGERLLLSKLSLTLHSGWRVGVIGRNGCGKTSLFGALLGEIEADSGDLALPRGFRIATVAQETPSLPDPAIDFVIEGDVEIAKALRAEREALEREDYDAAVEAHHRIEELHGYDARARAARLLHGLGFKADVHEKPVGEFSGGWRVRLNLARALMAPSDVLLLDEPTNHLDLDAVVWLEEWLKRYDGMILIISHDREFLDGVTSHILHLVDGQGNFYIGNYSQFERQRAEQLRQKQIAFEKEQAERAHLQSFIDRFKAKASKAKQAQSRVKRLEKMKGMEAVRAERPFHFSFAASDKLPNTLLRLNDIDAGYGEIKILNQVKFGLDSGDRVGLIGPNGEGKSTLIKTIAGELGILSGERVVHPDLRIGYFAQHTVESLDLKASAFDHIKRISPNADDGGIRSFLGSFAFIGDRVFEVIAPFSGGEKARLALAIIAWQKPNLLLLDEPTNHLDLEMREALADALNDFAGAIVLVSHDRSLMGLVCETFWRVADAEVIPFDGDFDDYAAWLRTRRNSTRNAAKASALSNNSAASASAAIVVDAAKSNLISTITPVPSKSESKNSVAERSGERSNERAVVNDGLSSGERRKLAAEQREREKPLRNQLNKLEAKIAALQKEQSELGAKLSDAASYSGGANVASIAKQQGEIARQISDAEAQWLTLYESLEA